LRLKGTATCSQEPSTFYQHSSTYRNIGFDVLLTMHLSIFILTINQLDAQNLFYSKFISCLYMFRAPCTHHQEVKIAKDKQKYRFHTNEIQFNKIHYLYCCTLRS